MEGSAPNDHSQHLISSEFRPVRAWSSNLAVIWLMVKDGRRTATLILVLLAIFHVSIGDQVWRPARDFVFDAYQRLAPRTVSRLPVVIVDIDDSSLAEFGRWPWPRSRLARLIRATHELGALAIGLDIIMPEADSLSPGSIFADREDVTPALRSAVDRLATNDTILAETLRQTPSVVARAAVLDAQPQISPTQTQTASVIVGELTPGHLPSFKGHVTNLPEIETAASGHGYLNDIREADGVVRAMPLVINIDGTVAPSLGLELLRVASGQTHYVIHANARGLTGVQLGSSFVETDADGRIRLHFSPAYAMRRVSAGSILRGEISPKTFTNQVAIIGVTAIGLVDIAATPLTARMDGVEIQAQLIENILDLARLKRPAGIRWLESLTLIGFATLLIFFLPRVRPGYGVVIFLLGVIILAGASFVCYQSAKVLFDPSFASAGNALILTVLLAAGFSAADKRRRELDAALEAERLDRVRIAGELSAAREIQMGMLPNPEKIDKLPLHIEFHALLEPAREVGGDLYDAFMLDEYRFFFLLGDVCGKGVSAALFMALTKTLCKSMARRERLPLESFVRLLNQELSHENPAELFLTAVIGVIDVRSGELEWCNAGHDAPVLLRAGAPLRTLTDRGGPALCILDDFPYSTGRLQLEDGDLLVLITDGITEAENSSHDFYGAERAFARLNALEEHQRHAAVACRELYLDVTRFTNGIEASDDITIVAIRLNGADQGAKLA
jgi:adenylate cyclase